MEMPGGGYFNVGRGQITDDSELAMCLLWAIVEGNRDGGGTSVLSMPHIARRYGMWVNSDPFDCGQTVG